MNGGGEARLRTRPLFRAVLVRVTVLLVVVYVGCLAMRSIGWNLGSDRWFSLVVADGLSLGIDWVAAAVCWLAVARVGFRRWEVPLAAAGVTSYTVSDTLYTWMLAEDGSVPFPSLADVGFLLIYPLMLAALVVAVRRHSQGLTSSVWLDCAVGSLGAAAVLAVLLSQVLTSALTGSSPLATAVAVVYPMLDLLLVAAVAGIAALGGRRLGRRWVLLALGLLAFAAADLVYALEVTADTYVVGTPLDAGWAIGLVLISLWVDGARQREDSTSLESSSNTGAAALAVSTVAAVAGLGILIAGNRAQLSTLAVALAGITLLAAVVRTTLAFRLLVQMADLRRKAATSDDLTGLPNRRALYAEGHARLEVSRSLSQALLMLDLDRFKEVNDNLGHHTGDLLLVQVGARLSEHLREGDMLARLGGDEFAVLLQNVDHHEAAGVAVKLCAALAEPFVVETKTLHTSVSVGIALFPDHGRNLSALLRRADIAMYQAKASSDSHRVYCGTDEADVATRLRTMEELRTALASGQMILHYQPKIDLDTGDVHDVEALVRWDHPARGLQYPDAFLGLVEEYGLMRTLTRVVLGLALDQAAAWSAAGRRLTISVNLSASSLVDTDLPNQVASMLAARDLPPHALRLEITEDFLMADRERARAILTRLRQSGVQISVDDFGTGYSSLSYLRDLPIDELKLDRSFIFPMADDARAAALVASTIALAHSLGLRMVAEGVETQVAYTELARLGCDQAQGYFMSRPVPAAELEHWLSTRLLAGNDADLPLVRPFTAL